MQLQIQNINLIREANITLNGLTVLAGENDSGKSTVGKLLFAIIQAFKHYDKSLGEDKKINIQERVENIYRLVRQIFLFDNAPDLKIAFLPANFFNDIIHITDLTDAAYQATAITTLFEKKIRQLHAAQSDTPHHIPSIIREMEEFSAMLLLLLKNNSLAEQIEPALHKLLSSEFRFELLPNNAAEQKTVVSLSEGGNPIMNFTLGNHVIEHLEITDQLLFNDAFFIETPMILQLYDVLHSTVPERGVDFGRRRLPFHLTDLITKLKNIQYVSETLTEAQEPLFAVLQNTRDLMQGGFSFDESDQDFVFQRGETLKIKPLNTASGIKTFGIIQLLIHLGLLNSQSLLIIDEPETHLHPAWQVEYARLMVALVKHGIPVLLTSHSPYVIQALKVEGEKEGIGDMINYYLAERNEDNTSTIHDVTDDLNRIFVKLSAPMQALVWNQ